MLLSSSSPSTHKQEGKDELQWPQPRETVDKHAEQSHEHLEAAYSMHTRLVKHFPALHNMHIQSHLVLPCTHQKPMNSTCTAVMQGCSGVRALECRVC